MCWPFSVQTHCVLCFVEIELEGALRNDELVMNSDELPRLGSIIDDVAQLSAQSLENLSM